MRIRGSSEERYYFRKIIEIVLEGREEVVSFGHFCCFELVTARSGYTSLVLDFIVCFDSLPDASSPVTFLNSNFISIRTGHILASLEGL